MTNAIGWRVDFEDFQEGKQTLLIPARKFVDANKTTKPLEQSTIKEEKEESSKDEIQKLDVPAADDGSGSDSDASHHKLENSILEQFSPQKVQTIDLDEDDRRARLRQRAEQRKSLHERQMAQELQLQEKTAKDREKILAQEQKMKSIEAQIKNQM